MSVFSALNTAVSGLTAQSVAFSNISNNISNSQTVGYKAVDTSFSNYVEAAGALEGQSGTVVATTQYSNQAAGPITASSSNAAVAVNGNGFFAVSKISGLSTATTPAFSNTQYYTRAGDFSSDRNGFLVNSAKEYLDGYMVSPTTGQLDTSKLQPINVSNVAFRPTVTSNVTMAPVLAGVTTLVPPATGATQSSTQTVYDKAGAAHQLGLSWTQTAGATATTSGTWSLSVSGTAAATAPVATVIFNTDGTLQSIAQGTPATANAVPGSQASFTIGPVGSDTTSISLNLGAIGTASGTTMNSAAGAAFSAGTPSQDGIGTGNFTGFAMQTDGSVNATFDNGQSQLIAKVPLATFTNANALQSQDGQAYTATIGSGPASVQMTGLNGAGTLETKSVEGSSTSLDADLTKLIVAQQAYGASAKVVTTAEQMLQSALSMKQ